MKVVKGYEKIHGRTRIAGLEFIDFLLLVLVYLFVFLLSKNLLANAGILLGAYLVLRVYKAGKPPHWLDSLFRFLRTPRTYPPVREQETEVLGEK